MPYLLHTPARGLHVGRHPPQPLYSDLLLTCHPPSYWLRLFSSQTFSRINTPTFLKPSQSSYLPAYEDGTECSEMSACKIQMPRNYPEESIQHSKHSEGLKSRRIYLPFQEYEQCHL